MKKIKNLKKNIYTITLFIFILFIYFQHKDTYVINKKNDITKVLENIYELPYTEKDIYKINFIDDKIYLLYKDKTNNKYYTFHVLKKNIFFKNKYKTFYIKKNNLLNSKLNCETYKISTNNIIGFVYGINLNINDCNTIVKIYTNQYKNYSTENINNISGNFIKVLKSKENLNYRIYNFNSLEEQKTFLEEFDKELNNE